MSEPSGSATSDRFGLQDLAVHLRAEGLRFGPSEMLDALRLVLRLSKKVQAPDASELRLLLRPILCKRMEDRDAFDQAFERWLDARAAESSEAEPKNEPVVAASRANRSWGLIAPLTLAIAILSYAFIHRKPLVEATAPAAVGSASNAVAPVTATESWQLTASAPAATEQRFVTATRENRELRAGWIFGTLGLLLAPLFLLRLPSAMLSRRRGKSQRRVHLDTQRLESEARQLVPAMPEDTAARLSRHIRDGHWDPHRMARRPALDLRRTLEATVKNLGLPTLRYRSSPLRPSYLVLIDGDVEQDPRGRLFYEWARRLLQRGWEVDIRVIHRAKNERAEDAPSVRSAHAAGRTQRNEFERSLDHLDDPPPGQRLLVLSDGHNFASATGVASSWVARARFRRWRERAMLTPTPLRDWGAREVAIEHPENSTDPGFLVLPLDEPALESWSLLLSTGTLFGLTLSEPERYPSVLVNREVEARDPNRAFEALDKLVAQLKLYLGDTGFRWLAALAVPPLIRWDVATLVGATLIDAQLARARTPSSELPARRVLLLRVNYRRLCQLPWLRLASHSEGSESRLGMPNWLRLRLLRELSPGAARRVRQAVRNALSSASPSELAGELELALDAPVSSGVAPKTKSTQRDEDFLYVGYMSGLSAHQLSLQAPASWSSWLRANGASARINSLSRIGELLARVWLRLMFRDGSPSSGPRAWGIAVTAGVVIWLAAIVGLTMVNPAALPAQVEHALFHTQARGVGASNAWPVAISFGAEGRRLLWVDFAGVLHSLDANTGVELRSFDGPAFRVDSASFSRDGSRVLMRNQTTAEVWDVATERRLFRVNDSIRDAALSAEGRRVAVAGITTSVWELTTDGQSHIVLELKKSVTSDNGPKTPVPPVLALALDASGSRLLTLEPDRGCSLFDQNGAVIVRVACLGDRPFVVNPAGTHFAIGSTRGWRVGEFASGKLGDPFPSVQNDLLSAVLSFKGDRIAINGEGGLEIYEVATRRAIMRLDSQYRADAFTTTGDRLLSYGLSDLLLSNLADANQQPLKIGDGSIQAAVFGAGDSKLALKEGGPAVQLLVALTRSAGGAWSAVHGNERLFSKNAVPGTPLAGHDRTVAWLLHLSAFVRDRWLWCLLSAAAFLPLFGLVDRWFVARALKRYVRG